MIRLFGIVSLILHLMILFNTIGRSWSFRILNLSTKQFSVGRSSYYNSKIMAVENDCWEDVIQMTVPELSFSSSYKGSSGRLGVIGGSELYTGAPFYAGMSALRTGADLVTIVCHEDAAIPIKSYSPELMVVPYQHDNMSKVLSTHLLTGRLHGVILGPGLSRKDSVLEACRDFVIQARKDHPNMPIVIDADALALFTQKEHSTILLQQLHNLNINNGCAPIVLTPNAAEYSRLINNFSSSSSLEHTFQGLNIILIQKGQFDTIVSYLNRKSITCWEEGGLKRSGGIGDILAGCLGSFLAWQNILQSRSNMDDNGDQGEDATLMACWMACTIVKQATKQAYQKYYRSMTAPDILPYIGPTLHNLTTKPFPIRTEKDNSSSSNKISEK